MCTATVTVVVLCVCMYICMYVCMYVCMSYLPTVPEFPRKSRILHSCPGVLATLTIVPDIGLIGATGNYGWGLWRYTNQHMQILTSANGTG